jgi:predicted RNA-binding protein (TIGR00451 family)
LKPPTPSQTQKLVGIANYQFGSDVGSVVFSRGVRIACSRRTGRIRHVYKRGKLVATLRPKDGLLALTTDGAFLILSRITNPPNLVTVQDDVGDFVQAGGDVFAKHVVQADEALRPADEVLVTNQQRVLLAVGKAVLSGREMKFFKRGVAVKVRKGISENSVPDESALEL